MKIAKIEPLFINVSEKSNWTFFRVTADEGLSGIGEATLQGWEGVQLACLERMAPQLIGKTFEQALPLLTVYPHSFGGLAANSVLSALEMALVDIRAQAAQVPVHVLLDCHWRFDEATAKHVIRELNPVKPFWLECMVSESPEGQPALARARQYASSPKMRDMTKS